MYCTNCGNKVGDNTDVCLKCGSLINKQNNISNTNKNKNKNNKKWIIGVIIFIGILLISLFYSINALNKAVDSGINELALEIKEKAINKHKQDNLDYSKCYNIEELGIEDYYGSVKVTKTEFGYDVDVWLSNDSVFLIIKYQNDKAISTKLSTGSLKNFTCENY